MLKVLEEARIPVQCIAGTNGAFIGAAYCSGLSIAEMEETASRIRSRHLARWTVSKLGLASNERMGDLLHKILKHKSFDGLKIPLAVTATDCATGEGVVFRAGLLSASLTRCARAALTQECFSLSRLTGVILWTECWCIPCLRRRCEPWA